SQGAAQAEAPQPQPQAAQLPGYLAEDREQRTEDRLGRESGRGRALRSFVCCPLISVLCPPIRARSSVGQNAPLITVLSQVRVLPGPPCTAAPLGRPSSLHRYT